MWRTKETFAGEREELNNEQKKCEQRRIGVSGILCICNIYRLCNDDIFIFLDTSNSNYDISC